jgi:hypothetical protein
MYKRTIFSKISWNSSGWSGETYKIKMGVWLDKKINTSYN